MKRTHSAVALLMSILFLIFTSSLLVVILTAANSYKGLSNYTGANYEERTCLQYIVSKLRSCDASDTIEISSFGDSECISFSTRIDNVEYTTYLYTYDGMLMELLCEADVELDAEAGFEIMKMKNLSFNFEASDLLRIGCQRKDGADVRTYLALKNKVSEK